MRKFGALMAGLLMAIGMVSVQGALAQQPALATPEEPLAWDDCNLSRLCLYEYANGGGVPKRIGENVYSLRAWRFDNGHAVDNNSGSVWNKDDYGWVVHDYYNCNGEPGHSKVVNINSRFNLGTYGLWHKVSSACQIR